MRILVILFYLSITISSTILASEGLYDKYFPEGVEIGVDAKKLKKNRPNAVKISATTLIERIIKNKKISKLYSYHFKDLKLRGISCGIMISKEKNKSEKKRNGIFSFFKKSFIKKSDLKIMRLDGSLNKQEITASLWEDKSKNIHIYFVSNINEITLIFFDPKHLGKKDFFVDSKEMVKYEKSISLIREKIKSRKDNEKNTQNK